MSIRGEHPARIVPADVDGYWRGGESGHLLMAYCTQCERWTPPAEVCLTCSGALEYRPVSGEGTVYTFTVNHKRFSPAVEPPYVIAIVELDEQPGLRLPVSIVDCAEDEVSIGMRVRAHFERHGAAFVPVFTPLAM